MRAAGAGLEELRFLQGRRASAPADVEGLGAGFGHVFGQLQQSSAKRGC
jgi:hypothetical protein